MDAGYHRLLWRRPRGRPYHATRNPDAGRTAMDSVRPVRDKRKRLPRYQILRTRSQAHSDPMSIMPQRRIETAITRLGSTHVVDLRRDFEDTEDIRYHIRTDTASSATINGLRQQFSLTMRDGPMTGSLTITNPPKEVVALFDRGAVTIDIATGYSNTDLTTVANLIATSITFRRYRTDWQLVVQCADVSDDALKRPVVYSTSASERGVISESPRSALFYIARQAQLALVGEWRVPERPGIHFYSSGTLEDALNKLLGDQLIAAGAEYPGLGLRWSVSNHILFIHERDPLLNPNDNGRQEIIVTPSSGLAEEPWVDSEGLTHIRHILLPWMRTGDRIRLAGQNGSTEISELTHRGDTHSDTWETTMAGLYAES